MEELMKKTSLLGLVCFGGLGFLSGDLWASAATPQQVADPATMYIRSDIARQVKGLSEQGRLRNHVQARTLGEKRLGTCIKSIEDVTPALVAWLNGTNEMLPEPTPPAPEPIVQKTAEDLHDDILRSEGNTKDTVNFMFTIYKKFGSADAQEGSIAKRVYNKVGDGKREDAYPAPRLIELDKYSDALKSFFDPSYHFPGYKPAEEDKTIRDMAKRLADFKLKTSEDPEPLPPPSGPAPAPAPNPITISIIQNMDYSNICYLIYQLQQVGISLEGVKLKEQPHKPEEWRWNDEQVKQLSAPAQDEIKKKFAEQRENERLVSSVGSPACCRIL